MIRPRKLIDVTLYLNSGQTIHFRCTEIKSKSEANKLSSLTVEGRRGTLGLYTRLDDISAVTYGPARWRISA